MKKSALLACLGIAVAASLGAATYFLAGREVKEGNPALRSAPAFSLKDFDGKTHRLDDYRGKVVVLHFWASWCPPCIGEIPQWLEWTHRYQDQPVAFVAISLDVNWNDALKVLPGKSIPKNVISLLDEQGKAPEEYGTYQFPETYLLDANLKILTKWVGPQEWSNSNVDRWMKTALSSLKSP